MDAKKFKKYKKKRYHEDKKFRKRVIESVKKYHKTEKGKRVRKKYLAKKRKADPDYYKNYMKKRRDEARENGICTVCLKNKARENFLLCEECSDKNNKKNKNRLTDRERITKRIYKAVGFE